MFSYKLNNHNGKVLWRLTTITKVAFGLFIYFFPFLFYFETKVSFSYSSHCRQILSTKDERRQTDKRDGRFVKGYKIFLLYTYKSRFPWLSWLIQVTRIQYSVGLHVKPTPCVLLTSLSMTGGESNKLIILILSFGRHACDVHCMLYI